MSSSTAEYGMTTRTGGGDTVRREPRFLLAPFSGRTWRETLHLVLDLPVGVAAFSYVITTLVAGIGTVLTFVGFPVLAASLGGARGIGAMERARARALLGTDVPAPVQPKPNRPGPVAWLGAVLKSGANWRAALYSVLMLPVGIFNFTVAVVLWSVSLTTALYPLYHWVFPTYVGWPGYRLWENNGHVHYISTLPEIAGTCVAGIVLTLLTAQVVRGLAGVRRAMVSGLLR
ncbi:sensor domain-containing protein [Streptacidiphilus rugosus]|uniref:sensor domain-containing protein n=1 Tax=Streptacidiphilus rugosus TaxID=405783 RepID=UPI00068EDEE6|nr:sensor domain-containing protein [Streptacidiphilus rugosus]